MVFDVYKEGSIKDAERVNRGSSDSTQFKNIAPGHSTQQWRTFLRGSDYKKNLIQFFVNAWKQQKHSASIGTKQLHNMLHARTTASSSLKMDVTK